MSDDVLEIAQTTEILESAQTAEIADTAVPAVPAVAAVPAVPAVPVEPAVPAAIAYSNQDHVERMRTIMLGFIDDPRKAALDADALLAEVLRSVTESLARRRGELEAESSDAATPDTERLRQVVRRSRELVDVLAQAV